MGKNNEKYLSNNYRSIDLPEQVLHRVRTRASSFNPWTPNDPYMGRTAPLTSKVAFYIFIQQIYVLNILNMIYTLRIFLLKMQFVS